MARYVGEGCKQPRERSSLPTAQGSSAMHQPPPSIGWRRSAALTLASSGSTASAGRSEATVGAATAMSPSPESSTPALTAAADSSLAARFKAESTGGRTPASATGCAPAPAPRSTAAARRASVHLAATSGGRNAVLLSGYARWADRKARPSAAPGGEPAGADAIKSLSRSRKNPDSCQCRSCSQVKGPSMRAK